MFIFANDLQELEFVINQCQIVITVGCNFLDHFLDLETERERERERERVSE
jgi:hypothetical protein